MQEALGVIYEILRGEYNVKAEMAAETRIQDIGIDSVDLIGFLYSLEEKTGVKIPDEDLTSDRLKTIGQFADYVAAHRTRT